MTIHINTDSGAYDVTVESGIVSKVGQLFNLDRRVLIVTDTGVPKEYASSVAAQCRTGIICTVEAGEASKSISTLEHLLKLMLEQGFSRKDAVVAVGGGVVGDLAGFAASIYMRGIDFYNIPTTLLSQIDSSIGGKTAVNLDGVKNIVGSFYQPRGVLVDPELLKTLPHRQLSNGLAEAIKVALTSDPELFEILEHKDIPGNLTEIIVRALGVKKDVVEKDEKESGLRRVLNMGHTVGHAIESSTKLQELYHGECVALGLLPMCGERIRQRVIDVLKKCGLYRVMNYDWEEISAALLHDKKGDRDMLTVITVDEIGSFGMEEMSFSAVLDKAKCVLEGLKK